MAKGRFGDLWVARQIVRYLINQQYMHLTARRGVVRRVSEWLHVSERSVEKALTMLYESGVVSKENVMGLFEAERDEISYTLKAASRLVLRIDPLNILELTDNLLLKDYEKEISHLPQKEKEFLILTKKTDFLMIRSSKLNVYNFLHESWMRRAGTNKERILQAVKNEFLGRDFESLLPNNTPESIALDEFLFGQETDDVMEYLSLWKAHQTS